MKCPNCDTELNDNVKFCKNCGEKIQITAEDKTKDKVIENVEEITNSSNEYKNDNTINQNTNPTDKNIIKDKIKELWQKLNTFEKSLTCLSGIFLLGFVVAVLAGKSSAMILSIVQIIGTVVTFLIERNIIKTPHKWVKIVIPIVCALMIFLYFNMFSSEKIDYKDIEKIVWSEMIIGNKLPEPPKNTGDITTNTDERLSLDIFDISIKQFYEYIDKCKNIGFVIDEQKSEYSYSAFSEEGYELKLYYSDYYKKMEIGLNVPKKYENITWSKSAIAKLLPTPKSLLGEIIEDSEKRFNVIISNMTLQDYTEYISLCEKSGFINETNKTDKMFKAKNTESYMVLVEYVGNNAIKIIIEEPEFDVSLKVQCDENLLFSTYDVKVYIDENFESTLSHGTSETYELKLSKGNHIIKFVNSEDDTIKGDFSTEVYQNGTIELKIHCYNYEISVESKSNSVIKQNEEKTDTKFSITMTEDSSTYAGKTKTDVEKEFKDKGFTNIQLYEVNTTENTNGIVTSVSINDDMFSKGDSFVSDSKVIIYHWKNDNSSSTEKENLDNNENENKEEQTDAEDKKDDKVSVSYSTNDYETAKKGNTGIFSYASTGYEYDIYWIIDFDKGYVYYFTEGNGENTCERLKIDQGDLNDYIRITWHDSGNVWSYRLFFKYKNQPSILMIQDHNGFNLEYSPTNLDEALKIRDTKIIKDY